MVRIGQSAIPEVRYHAPAGTTPGVEVLALDALHRRMRGFPAARAVQRPDFHHLICVDAGALWHMVDFTGYTLEAGSVLWVRPGQVQQFGDLTAAAGHVVLFESGFVDSTTAAATRLDTAFDPAYRPLDDHDHARLTTTLGQLITELDATSDPRPVRALIAAHLLAVALLVLAHPAHQVGTTAPEHTETFLRFRTAVERQYPTRRDVAHYAASLGYAPRTLTRATQQAAGIGAKKYIDHRVILESKRLLAHTNEPVHRIAAHLGFDDTSNFVKYFHQRAGHTPTTFRAQFHPAPST